MIYLTPSSGVSNDVTNVLFGTPSSSTTQSPSSNHAPSPSHSPVPVTSPVPVPTSTPSRVRHNPTPTSPHNILHDRDYDNDNDNDTSSDNIDDDHDHDKARNNHHTHGSPGSCAVHWLSLPVTSLVAGTATLTSSISSGSSSKDNSSRSSGSRSKDNSSDSSRSGDDSVGSDNDNSGSNVTTTTITTTTTTTMTTMMTTKMSTTRSYTMVYTTTTPLTAEEDASPHPFSRYRYRYRIYDHHGGPFGNNLFSTTTASTTTSNNSKGMIFDTNLSPSPSPDAISPTNPGFLSSNSSYPVNGKSYRRTSPSSSSSPSLDQVGSLCCYNCLITISITIFVLCCYNTMNLHGIIDDISRNNQASILTTHPTLNPFPIPL